MCLIVCLLQQVANERSAKTRHLAQTVYWHSECVYSDFNVQQLVQHQQQQQRQWSKTCSIKTLHWSEQLAIGNNCANNVRKMCHWVIDLIHYIMDIFAESRTEILTTFFLSALDSSAALWYLKDRNNTDLCRLQTKITFFFSNHSHCSFQVCVSVLICALSFLFQKAVVRNAFIWLWLKS